MKTSIRDIIGVLLLVLVIFGAVQFALQSFRVDGGSMEPSFHNSQYLLVDKLTYRFRSPARGDVVVFHNPQFPDELYIKRIVALPGDHVEIGDGYIYVNGVQLEETPDFGPISSSNEYSVTLGQDEYFVIGDNRSNSSGSQTFGPVPRDNIVGRVWLCYWPPSNWGLSPEYSATAVDHVVTASVCTV